MEKFEESIKMYGEGRRELYEEKRKTKYVKWNVAEAKRTVDA